MSRYRPPYRSLEDRLLANSYLDVVTGCRVWLGYCGLSRSGVYARLSVRVPGKPYPVPMYAHRLAWEIWNERKIPPGYEIDHVCENTICIAPEHLRLVDGDTNKALYQARQYERERQERFGP